MEFQTKIIEGNKNPKAKIVWIGAGLLFVSMILMCIDKYRNYGFWLFGLAVVVLIIGVEQVIDRQALEEAKRREGYE